MLMNAKYNFHENHFEMSHIKIKLQITIKIYFV